MDGIRHAPRALLELLLWPLDLLPAIVSLGAVSTLTALLALVAVRWVSPQRLVGRARDRMAASIYEMRLFLDAPGRVLRAQGRLLGWMLVYLATLVPAAVVLTAPLGLLYLHLEARHGLAPLAAPATVVLRVELGEASATDRVAVEPGDGSLRLTAPLLRAPDEPAVYARLAIDRPGIHRVAVALDGERVEKRLDADPDAARVAPERRGGWRHLIALGDEGPIAGDAIRAISLQHPARQQGWLGLRVPWWGVWLAMTTGLALLFRRRLGVAL